MLMETRNTQRSDREWLSWPLLGAHNLDPFVVRSASGTLYGSRLGLDSRVSELQLASAIFAGSNIGINQAHHSQSRTQPPKRTVITST